MADPEESPPISRIATRLMAVGGVVGVVLGGSRARGVNAADADYDVGVYYSDGHLLDLSGLSDAAREFDDAARPDLIAAPGGWGNWVNGGGWLVVDGARVDFILRDVGRVEIAVSDCLTGRVDAHYQPGHPHAYLNVMYAGELSVARILADRGGRLRLLQGRTSPYPAALKKAMLDLFGFEAGFSLMLAETYAEKDDEYYVAAHIVRAVSCLNQVLFAVNGEYCINEKKAVRMIESFAKKPDGYKARIDGVVARLGRDNAAACGELRALLSETLPLFS